MRILNKLRLKIAHILYAIYQMIGLHDHDICDLCLKMFNTKKGYGAWSDVTSCVSCGPTEADLAEARDMDMGDL